MQVTSETVIYRFSLQSHNKIMTATCSSKLTDLFSSGFPAYVIFFTESIMTAVFPYYPMSKTTGLIQNLEVHRLVNRELDCKRKPNLGDLIWLKYFESYHRQVTTEPSSYAASSISRGLGIPYQIVSNDFTEASSYVASSVSLQKRA